MCVDQSESYQETAFITRLPGAWRTTTFQSLMWQVDDIFVLPGVITSLCLDTVSTRMGVRHLLLLRNSLSGGRLL